MRRIFVSIFSTVLTCIPGYNYLHAQSTVRYGNIGLPVENVYLHTDKDFYLAGEVMWFKLYNIAAATHTKSSLSKVGYVELLSRTGEPVLQGKISLDSADGSGSFYLPLSVKSDAYILRAYTSWMKNAGSHTFFEKAVTIVNTMRADKATTTLTQEQASWEIVFFPEGGDLLEGVHSKVGFRVTGENGKGLAARGVLVDNSGDTLLHFQTGRFGLGQFSFTPAPGKIYSAIVTDSLGRAGSSALPQARADGFGLQLANKTAEKVQVKMVLLGAANNQAAPATLLVHQEGRVRFSANYNLIAGREIVIDIDKAKLGSGVNHFTLFDSKGRPVSERLYFLQSNISANTQLAPAKQRFATKEEIQLTTTITQQVADSFFCSMSVYKLEPWQGATPHNLASYLSMGTALGSQVENPLFYLSGAATADDADNLMLTHGWRKFKQDTSYNRTKPLVIPEYKGHFILGRVVNTTTGNSVAGADCFLTVPSSPYELYMATSDSTGVVRFEVRDYYGPGEVIVQPYIDNATNYRVDILNPFSEEKPYTSLPLLYVDSSYRAALLNHSIAMQAQNIYQPDSVVKFTLPSLIDTVPFFGRGEYTYDLDEYKRFTTMEEVLREYVTPVNVNMRNSVLAMNLYNAITKEIYRENILVMLDGVPLRDFNKIFSYDPLKIKRLRVVPRAYVMNTKLFSGVMSFETYKGRFDGFTMTPSLVAIGYEGLQLQREFYIPRHVAGDNNRIPDLRTTLLWKPDLQLSNNTPVKINFPASEQKGTFLVVLQGISSKGEPVFSTTTFVVE